MTFPSHAEILGFIAKIEPLEKTLIQFPGVTREQLRAMLREAALLMKADESGVQPADSPSPPARYEGQAASSTPPVAPAAETKGDVEGFSKSRLESQEADRPSLLRVFSDGASRGNPGPAGAGAVITKADGSIVARCGKFLGNQTNNYAEYMGLILGLEAALRLGANEVEVVADSELMVRQIQGAYRVKNEGLRPLYEKAKSLLQRFRKTAIRHVLREHNKLADEMSNRAIDEKL